MNLTQIPGSNIFWGKPEWDEIFQYKTLKFREIGGAKVGVFVCGNKYIVEDIYDNCENYNTAAVKYELNTENF